MQCGRCHGVMTKERMYDWLEHDAQIYVTGWRWVSRCADCGHVADGIALDASRMGGCQ